MTEKNSKLFLSRSWQALEQRLLSEIESEKKDDPLHPVFILVGSQLLAQYLELSIYPGLREKGLGINVRFMLFPELVEKYFYGGEFPGYRPKADRNLRYVLLKDILKKIPGDHYFASVRTASGLAQTLIAEDQDLKDGLITGEWLSRARKQLKGAKFDAFFEILEELDQRQAGFEQDEQRYLAAIDNARKYPGLPGADKIFLYGFYDYTAVQRELVRAVSENINVDAFMVRPENETYSSFTDEVFNFYQKLGLKTETIDFKTPGTDLGKFKNSLNTDRPEKVDADGALRIVFAPGVEREALEICREVMGLVRTKGLKFNEIGVLARDFNAYRRPLKQAFDLHGIPCYLPAGEPVSDFSPVRALALLLRIPQEDENFSRRSVIKFFSSHALRKEVFGSGDASVSNLFDIVSREAFIVSTSNEWQERLRDYLTALSARLEKTKSKKDSDDDDDFRVQKIGLLQKKIDAARELLELSSRLFPELEALLKEKSYGGLSERVKKLAGQYIDFSVVSGDGEGSSLKEKVDQALDELANLDRGNTPADFKTFLEIFSREISGQAVKTRGSGQQGVCLADIMTARGVCFKAVIVPGLCEGGFPLKASESPHLSDQEREAINQANLAEGTAFLPLKWRQNLEERLLFYLACEQASQFLILSSPWLDLAANQDKTTSYLLVYSLSKFMGREIEFDKLQKLAQGDNQWIHWVELGDFAPKSEELAINATDWELLKLERAESAADKAHLLKDETAARLVALARGRWLGGEPGEFSGYIGGKNFAPGKFSLVSQNVSASRLKKFLGCPFSYFIEKVLQVEEVEEPARLWGFGHFEQGNLIHALLEKLFAELNSREKAADKKKYQEALRRILDTDGLKYLLENFPAARAIIGLELEEIYFYLSRWHEKLLPEPGYDRWELEKSTLDSPATLDLGKGRSVRLSGVMDRVDQDKKGQRACVVDYKISGGVEKDAARQIQLPIYLFSVQNLLGFPKENLEAKFLIAVPEKLGEVKPVKITGRNMEQHLSTLRSLVNAAVDYIEKGVFVPQADRNCKNCSYKIACYGASTAQQQKQDNQWVRDLKELVKAAGFKEKNEG